MSNRPKDCCKDCWEGFIDPERAVGEGGYREGQKFRQRPAPHPGPRCATHHHEERKRVKAANHERRVQNVYGLNAGDYDRLYVHQTGVCAICKRATGATRKLSVDHNHATGKVRGLLCRPCNDMLGHARDSVFFFYRAAGYLQNPPAKDVLNNDD